MNTEVIYLEIYDFQSILQSGRKAFHKGKWVTECIAVRFKLIKPE